MSALVALVTDFGTRDSYVAEMKARASVRVPGVSWLDVTHEIPPFDILAAALVIERVLAELPRGSALVAVVDPGVGSSRRKVVALRRGVCLVGPDNGVLPAHGADALFAIDDTRWRATSDAATFDGREVFAPLGAMLAAGLNPALVGPAIDSCAPWVIPDDALFVERGDRRYARGVVMALDRFGNAVTNVRMPGETGSLCVTSPSRFAGPVQRTYAAVATGAAVALIGSSGRLELAVREGSSNVAPGTAVGVEWRAS